MGGPHSPNVRTFVHNRLTLAILVGSPALVVGMFAILFRPGAFDFQDPSPSSMVMIGFWVVFAAFFFGLTYALLQICTERTILRRERLVGLRPGAYVASKVTVLVPFLLLVIVGMLGVLRLLDRLPSRSAVDLRLADGRTVAVRTGRARPRAAHVRAGRLRGPSDARASDAVLPRGAVLGCDPAGAPDGGARCGPQCGDPVALELRSGRSRPRSATHPRRRRLAARPSVARVVRRRGHMVDRHVLAYPHRIRTRVPRGDLGRGRAEHAARRCVEARPPKRSTEGVN